MPRAGKVSDVSDRINGPGEAAVTDRLLHIADLHFWRVVFDPRRLAGKRFLGNLNVALRRRREFAMQRAGEFAGRVAAIGPKSVLLTGDFSCTALDEEFALARDFVDDLAARGMDVHLIPGNHDVYTFSAQRRRAFERHFAPYAGDTGLPQLDRLPGGTPLIRVPTVSANWLSSRGRIGRATIDAARALIEGTTGPVIVGAHYPVLGATYGYSLSRSRRLRQAGALRRMLGGTGRPILFVAGHVHRFSLVRDRQYPQIQYLTTGAFFRHDARTQRHAEFSEIHVQGCEFHVYHHTLHDVWARKRVGAAAAQ